jgi:hypothetical protein
LQLAGVPEQSAEIKPKDNTNKIPKTINKLSLFLLIIFNLN